MYIEQDINFIGINLLFNIRIPSKLRNIIAFTYCTFTMN